RLADADRRLGGARHRAARHRRLEARQHAAALPLSRRSGLRRRGRRQPRRKLFLQEDRLRREEMKATLLCTAVLAAFATAAEARITRVVIDPALSQSPTFGGYAWPGVGQYERLARIASGEWNRHEPQNSPCGDTGLRTP